ncbi:hypothetical protein C8D79_0041 [Bacteriovorax stolpii]|nr:hypothetical protein C8D79_0041 [Bacteriovorax stolpii]
MEESSLLREKVGNFDSRAFDMGKIYPTDQIKLQAFFPGLTWFELWNDTGTDSDALTS